MKMLHLLKALLRPSANNDASNAQDVRKVKAKEQLVAQIDAWVNEGGSTGNEAT